MKSEVEKPRLIYVGDPMCSWCYGISDELGQVVAHFKDKVELEVVMGGLRAGGGEEWNQSFRDFLRHHWEDVGMRSGQPFSFKLLDLEYFDYDTEPACRAVVTAQSMDETLAFSFFKEVQKGFYMESRDTKKVEFYKTICERMDIDFKEFSKRFDSFEMKEKTVNHFQRSANLGARSFPTVLLQYRGQTHRIAIGYSTFEKMKTRIEEVIR